jgi:hypothetical protein
MSTSVEELADALRQALSSHYCGQITCSRALSVLNEYEAASGVTRFTPPHAGRLVADPDAAPGDPTPIITGYARLEAAKRLGFIDGTPWVATNAFGIQVLKTDSYQALLNRLSQCVPYPNWRITISEYHGKPQTFRLL